MVERQVPAARAARGLLFAAGALAAICAGLGGAAAQEGGDEPATAVRNCIDLRSLDRTAVVDDDTLLFFMRGGQVYRNDLPNRCPQLRSEQRFMYRVALSQLCDIDVITVLNDMGFGFLPGASCGLGKFEPISEDVAEQLLSGSD